MVLCSETRDVLTGFMQLMFTNHLLSADSGTNDKELKKSIGQLKVAVQKVQKEMLRMSTKIDSLANIVYNITSTGCEWK